MTMQNMRAIIDGENKLNDSNFSTWYRNLKIVLRYEKLLYTIEEASLKEPGIDATDDELDTYARWKVLEIGAHKPIKLAM